MAHIDNPDSQLTAVKWRFPSVHPEGRKFAVIAGAIAFFLLILESEFAELLGWLMVGVTIWVATFFRDPIRTTPSDPKLIVSPADGLVTMITRVPSPPELRGELGEGQFTRVSTYWRAASLAMQTIPLSEMKSPASRSLSPS